MNQLTFHTGTFAGETIRTTVGGYASVYDIMRVTGVGRDAPTAWSELKHKLPAVHSTKYFKFTGRGQRDTPVINGQGLVRLLFLLPGKKARLFVAESAETLVRFIGGDETLVQSIRYNREISETDPSSVQAFMADNIQVSRRNRDENIPPYEAATRKNLPKQATGYLYCVSSEHMDFVKVGYWKSGVDQLTKRYKTYYPDPTITTKEVIDCRASERLILNHFHEYIISGELIEKSQWANIIAFIEETK